MSELKPCPFCGEDAELTPEELGDYLRICVSCKCGATISYDASVGKESLYKTVTRKWNTRHDDWISVEDGLPEDNHYKDILIFDKVPRVGCYSKERKFEYWLGSYCNLDSSSSQETITHWKPITLPEAKK